MPSKVVFYSSLFIFTKLILLICILVKDYNEDFIERTTTTINPNLHICCECGMFFEVEGNRSKKKLEVFMFMHVHKYLCNVFTPKPDVIIKVASIHSMMTSSGGIIKL